MNVNTLWRKDFDEKSTISELPRQWSSHGYEIDELLGQGSYGAVYRMVRNKGTDQEEYWALKVIEKNL